MNVRRSLPVYPDKQTFLVSLGMSQRARRAPLQIPPRPMSDFVHRALRFEEERKDRVDVDGILDEAQRHIDTSFLRVLG